MQNQPTNAPEDDHAVHHRRDDRGLPAEERKEDELAAVALTPGDGLMVIDDDD